MKSSIPGNILEFRFDLFEEDAVEKLKMLREKIDLPVIFALRKKDQGGYFHGSEKERLEKILQLALLAPTYFDLEYDTPSDFLKTFTTQFPSIRVILSYHNFQETPQHLNALLETMQKTPASLYKLACQANSTNDSLRMLAFVRKTGVLGMCMGEKGEITRILSPLMGSPWVYAYLFPNQKTTEGQLSIEKLTTLYSNRTHSPALFGLIGSSVTKSISHFIHNKTMRDLSLDALYVKMGVEIEELNEFFSLAKEIGFQGLSVTMPLKEKVIPFLDQIDRNAHEIGAVNTLSFQNGRLVGFNTDGKGALDALEAKCQVRDKRMIILGAGGAARAIVHEAKKRKAIVWVLNRTEEKALTLASCFGIEGGALSLIDKLEYDILINTTPHPLPISPSAIRPDTIVMDIKTLPKMSLLLQEAKAKNCTLVFGYEMFINQALAQYDLWFPSQFDKAQAHAFMEKCTLQHL